MENYNEDYETIKQEYQRAVQAALTNAETAPPGIPANVMASVVGTVYGDAVKGRKDATVTEIKEFLKTVPPAVEGGGSRYAGFDREKDELAITMLKEAGFSSATLLDIMAVPDNMGMGFGNLASNPAVALMTQDKVDQWKKYVVNQWGPKLIEEGRKDIDFEGWINRFREGMICIDSRNMDTDLAKGVIFHEAGHKVLRLESECGEVFIFEFEKIRKRIGLESAVKWFQNVREPSYNRANGLLKEPGCKDFLLLLQKYMPESHFYAEYRDKYRTLMGAELVPSQELAEALESERQKKEEEAARNASLAIQPGLIISGTPGQLKTQVPKESIMRGKGVLTPSSPDKGEEVVFAGWRWEVTSKGEIKGQFGVYFTLKCLKQVE
ncbi:hypothetical protein [Streptomyces sp. NPDC126514]|uniref:hypothetical protein n=1 Tax=Streptomyces sp. NPDC126514 TaxID=3155210 RepID=UPI00332EF13F